MKKYTVVEGVVTGEDITVAEGIVEAVKIPFSLLTKDAAPVDAQVAATASIAAFGGGLLWGENMGHKREREGKKPFIGQ